MEYKGYGVLVSNNHEGAYLIHSGRKGMKWYQHIFGAVKSAGRKIKSAGSIVKNYRNDNKDKKVQKKLEQKQKEAERRLKKFEYEKDRPKKKVNIRKLSDEELKKRIDRLDLEKTYVKKMKELDNPIYETKIHKGFEIASKSFAKGFEDIGTQVAGQVLGIAVNKIAEKAGYKDGKFVDPKHLQRKK